jgi:hypothetical protein
MRDKRITTAAIAILAISALLLLATTSGAMAQESLLYSFNRFSTRLATSTAPFQEEVRMASGWCTN